MIIKIIFFLGMLRLLFVEYCLLLIRITYKLGTKEATESPKLAVLKIFDEK